MNSSNTCTAPAETPKAEYASPHLACLGKIAAVTQKSGGTSDGAAAKMGKSGQG